MSPKPNCNSKKPDAELFSDLCLLCNLWHLILIFKLANMLLNKRQVFLQRLL